MATAGRDYIGIGVGAMVFDGEGRVFLARRGPDARNEVDTWEFPGGQVAFGERLADAVHREIREEYGIEIEIRRLLGVFDHILVDERQHWISATYIARHVGGVPEIREPGKCVEIGWFRLDALPGNLSQISRDNVRSFLDGLQGVAGG